MTNKENGISFSAVSQIKSLEPWKEVDRADAIKPMKRPWVSCSWRGKSWTGRRSGRKLETSR